LIRVHVIMEQTPEDLERVLNEFLASNEERIKEVQDVSVTRSADGTYCGTVTYTEQDKPRHGESIGPRR
jgi:hypothetical protein